MADVAMPRLSDSMEEGTILKWLKAEGEEVARGEELVEIETDKAAMVYESDQDGTLQRVALPARPVEAGADPPLGAAIPSVSSTAPTICGSWG